MSFRLRYRPVTIPLPLHRYRDRPSTTITDRYHIVTYSYPALVTDRPPLLTVPHR